MDVRRTVFGWWKEGVEELQNEIPVREGELSVGHSFHSIGQHRNVFCLLVDSFDDIQSP